MTKHNIYRVLLLVFFDDKAGKFLLGQLIAPIKKAAL